MKKSILFFISTLVFTACGNQINSSNSLELNSSHIFGGEKIDTDHFLAQVTVGIDNQERNTICTGSIIANDLILTAAHCTEFALPEKIKVVFSNKIPNSKKSIQVKEYIQHKEYSKKDGIRNDLVIIKLIKPIPSSYRIIDLEKSIRLNLSEGDTLHIAGFGKSRFGIFAGGAGTLRAATVKIESFSPEDDLVVLNQREEKGICSGDSGGGSFAVVEGELAQVGVNSFVLKKESRNTADCKNKGFQVSVAKYFDWITKTMIELN